MVSSGRAHEKLPPRETGSKYPGFPICEIRGPSIIRSYAKYTRSNAPRETLPLPSSASM